jgi:hypothetical protein
MIDLAIQTLIDRRVEDALKRQKADIMKQLDESPNATRFSASKFIGLYIREKDYM